MNETELGKGIFLQETMPRARLYNCETCGKLFINNKKIPCPRCQQPKVMMVCRMNKKNPKLTIIVKGVGVA